MYFKKFDANGNAVDEAINGYKVEKIDISTSKTNFSVNVPNGAFTIIIKDCSVAFELNVNNHGKFTANTGDQLGPFLSGIQSVEISSLATSINPIEIMFIY